MSQTWNTDLYNDKHSFVYEYGKGLVDLLAPKSTETILDLGCGSGQLTAAIATAAKEVHGVDFSADMVKDAQANYPSIHFEQGDAAHFVRNAFYDAIFSNATLHWVSEHEKAMQSMYSSLKPGGRMVVEFGGKGNNGSMLKALRQVLTQRGYDENAKVDFWYFPSIGDYTHKLEKVGFRVARAEHYDRWTPLKGEEGMKDWFRMFGSTFFAGISTVEQEDILQEVEEKLKDTHFENGEWYADYKRIRVVAFKS